MLRIIIGLAGIGCTFIGGLHTSPVVKGTEMAQTLTETAPGSYLVNVIGASYRAGVEGRIMKVTGTEIMVDCKGIAPYDLPSYTALIKFDGYKVKSCRFKT